MVTLTDETVIATNMYWLPYVLVTLTDETVIASNVRYTLLKLLSSTCIQCLQAH